MGIPADARVVLLFGSLDIRKGVKSLLEWIATSGDPDLFLLAVGQETPEVARLLDGDYAQSLAARGSILRINRFVSDEEEQMAFAAADVAWLKYEGFYQMSGVLVKAARAGLKLELPECGVLGWYRQRLETEGSLHFGSHDWRNAIAILLKEGRDERFAGIVA